MQRIPTYISELDHAQFSQLTDTAVGGLRLQEELGQGHLLTSEQLPHGENQITTWLQSSSLPMTKVNIFCYKMYF